MNDTKGVDATVNLPVNESGNLKDHDISVIKAMKKKVSQTYSKKMKALLRRYLGILLKQQEWIDMVLRVHSAYFQDVWVAILYRTTFL